ncbi:AMP-binding protein [Chitinophaga oryzae]|uniref:AMP-binding protein n=1 Tax=Chitinophaga oryzae TaxID=2725414 RepID=A0AAE7D5U9_9BACT|nr:condensation domain-containing protein [Chitinophaga oryzae]QJB30479.1 AMP-binding protein [Chitinophaga oryzae]
MKFIPELFRERVMRHPDKVAIKEESLEITYNELEQFSNRLVSLVKQEIDNPFTSMLVVMPSSIRCIAAMLAAFKAGTIYVPVSLSFTDSRMEAILSSNFDGLLITHEEDVKAVDQLLQKFGVSARMLITVTKENKLWVKRAGEQAATLAESVLPGHQGREVHIDGGEACYGFYTSGSTGAGNCVIGMHKSIAHFVEWEISHFDLGPESIIAQIAAITFDASLKDILVSLCAGALLCIPDPVTKTNAALLLEWIKSNRVNVIQCVPSIMRNLLNICRAYPAESYLSGVELVVLAGEMLYNIDVLNIKKEISAGAKIANMYGATESTVLKSCHLIDLSAETIDSTGIVHVGRPISDTFLAVISGSSLCKIGEIGEIYIKTPFLTKGYLNNPALMEERFVQNPLVSDERDIVYKTGDYGRYLAGRNLEVLGRLDSEVKLNGIRVDLSYIESEILKLEEVYECVVKLEGPELQPELVCYYSGVVVPGSVMVSKLQPVLAQEFVPRLFIHFREMPHNLNGKIDRKVLQQEYERHKAANDETEEALSETEVALAAIWKEILHISKVGRQQSFFEIGGSSISAIQLTARVYKQMNVLLQLNDIFLHSTIAGMADLVDKTTKTDYVKIPVSPRQQYHRLAPVQRNIWLMRQIEDEAISYNLHAAYAFEGEVRPDLLQEAMTLLVRRHEILHTAFSVVAGEPVQYVVPEDEPEMHVPVITTPDQASVEAILKSEAHYQFALDRLPLMRVVLIRKGAGEYILSLVASHLIADGWSMGIVMHDFITIYESLVLKCAVSLPPVELQYIDYSEWLNDFITTEAYEQKMAYWKKQLSGSNPFVTLREEFVRPAVKTYNGGEVLMVLPGELHAMLQQMSGKSNVSMYMLLLTCFFVLVHLESGEDDMVVGIPNAGRGRKELEPMVGFFLNTVPVRIRDIRRQSFRSLLLQVKNALLEADKHQQVPFDNIVTELNLKRDPAFNAAFQLLFVMLNMPQVNNLAVTSVKNIRKLETETVIARYDITVFVEEMAGGSLQFKFEYNTDLYSRDNVNLKMQKYLLLLRMLTEDEQMPIGQIAIERYLGLSSRKGEMTATEKF